MPTDLIFQAAAIYTNGIIHDMTTAVLGLLFLGFVLMGFDLLKDLLDGHLMAMASRRKLTGHFITPGIDKKYLANGKLTMERDEENEKRPYRRDYY